MGSEGGSSTTLSQRVISGATYVEVILALSAEKKYIWWPNIDEDIKHTVRNCTDCQTVRNLPAVSSLTPCMRPIGPEFM